MNLSFPSVALPRVGTASVLALLALPAVLAGTPAMAADPAARPQTSLAQTVGDVIRPLMAQNRIPGMAVAVTVNGQRHVFNYGVASRQSGQRVTDSTLFEIGSLSKTFTATLGAWAQARGTLILSDPAGKYLPALAGSEVARVSLLDLATYNAGGLPLQFPDAVADQPQAIAYVKDWRPAWPAGTQRQYSNPSIGLFGLLAARSMGGTFDSAMQKRLFPALGLSHTWLRVPKDQQRHYAWGYSKADKPVRVGPGALDAEAYGVKTTATDMLHFVEVNMSYGARSAGPLHRAIGATHTGYYKVGDMTQGLGWEMYAWPARLETLLAGNSDDMALQPHEVARIDRPVQLRDGVLVNKTGSTNGFGGYVAYLPAQRIGVVLLANRNYPNAERVKAAYSLLGALGAMR